MTAPRAVTRTAPGCIPGTRTDYECLGNIDGRPAFRVRRIRPTTRSNRSTNMAFPNGRPLRPCSRKSRSSSSRIALFKNPRQSATIASIGATCTKRSSRPDRCAFALLHGQSAASDSTRRIAPPPAGTARPSRRKQNAPATVSRSDTPYLTYAAQHGKHSHWPQLRWRTRNDFSDSLADAAISASR